MSPHELFYFSEPTAIDYFSEDIGKQSVNVSWSPLPIATNKTYILSVKNSNNYRESFQLYEPYYLFTALDGAPPCEVYNFSVTATYVGATYTGAGCSVSSTVLSRMLPSLPDISRLESSLNYSLKKESNGGVTMKVIFMVSCYCVICSAVLQCSQLYAPHECVQPANYCEMYLVDDYVLEVRGPTSHSDVIQSPSNDTLSVNNLLDNKNYSFSVVVSNSVGNVSTDNRTICESLISCTCMTLYSLLILMYTDTTDVQMITAVTQEDKRFMLQCNFMDDSNAQGCMVVFVSSFGREKRNLTRNGTQAVETVNVTYPLSCYTQLHGFDIESDGSVGTLAIPGIIARNSSSIAPCVPEELKPNPSKLSWMHLSFLACVGQFLWVC